MHQGGHETKQRGEPIVVCERLTKVFKDFWMRSRARAVDSLDLTVHRNEIFGLLGPNGSGKSTTIKMVLGLLRATSGRIAVFGKLPSDVGIKRRIGYLPEESYLYGFLNARETLDYYAKLFELDLGTRRRRIDELLDMVGLAGAQYRQVREYSKGMQRRIGIAQALINDPDLLILDEPTTGLDPIGTRQIKDLILELGRRGKTVILCSHLLADVEDCVDRMVILYGGKIRAQGTCDDLLESRSRMSIETEPLDERTLAEVDRLIRSRSAGEKSVLRVARPRQRLEELFLDIVEKAQKEQVATAGATQGGGTAAFLAAPVQGEELIAQLTSPAGEPARASTPAAPAPGPDAGREDLSMIGSLLGGQPAPQGSTPPATPSVPRPAASRDDVDLSVIGSLLDDEDKGAKPGGPA